MALAETDPTTTTQAEDRLAKWRPKTDKRPEELGRFTNVEETARRHGWDAVRPLLDGVMTGDDVAMEVMEDIAAMRGKRGRAMFEQALEHGIDTVEDPPASFTTLFEQVDNLPDWVDMDQVRRGQIAYLRPGPMASFALTCSVIAGSMKAYGITRTVNFAGRFQDYAAVRARETSRWIVAACQPGGMERDSEGYKLTVQVRLMHAMTRRGISSSPNWDWDDWGLPMPDVDALYAISYDFTQAFVDPLLELGFKFSDQEIEDIYALWRYIGHTLAVPDHLLHRGPAQGRQFADMYLAMDPGPDVECRKMLHALIQTTTPEDGDGLDIFPEAVMRLMPPLRLRALLYGFIRHWAGKEVADDLEIPDTPWKYAPQAIKPAVHAWELARKLGRLDDEKAAWSTVRLLTAASQAQEEGETTLAPHETQEEAMVKSGERWGGDRGRSHTLER